MKTLPVIRLFLFSVSVFSLLQAQITVTTADMQAMLAVGKARYEYASDTAKYTMNVGTASVSGAQSWALPSVRYADTMLIGNAVPSSTPYLASFPTATHAQTVFLQANGTSIAYYGYSRIANDSLFELGFAMREITTSRDTTMFGMKTRFVVKFPLVLGTVVTSRDSNYYGPSDYEVRNGVETFDAYGTITLPNGSFQCLRSRKIERWTIAHVGVPLDTFTVCRFTWWTKEGHQATALAWRNDQTTGTIELEDVRYSEMINTPTSVSDNGTAVPASFALLQNYPNPFNPSTTVRFTLAEDASATLVVYDLLGRHIETLVDGELKAGLLHRVEFDGSGLPSGFYLMRLTSGSHQIVRKILLAK